MTDPGPLERATLPPTFQRWELVLEPGEERPTSASEWAGAIVLVERGCMEVECREGGRGSFQAGDLLALGWLPVRALRNRGSEAVELVAVRRRRS